MTELSAREGYADVTVAQIVGRAGVAKPTFYEHFKDKSDCFVQLIGLYFQQLTGSILAALDHDATVEQRIHQGIAAFVEFVAENDDRARVVLIESAAAGRASAERVADAHEMLAQFYESLRFESIEVNPDLKPLSRVRARGIVGALNEATTSVLRVGRAEDLLGQSEELIEMVTLLAAGHSTSQK